MPRHIGKWSAVETRQLTLAVNAHGDRAWKKVALCVKTRNARQCGFKWRKFAVREGPFGKWAEEEDDLLIMAIATLGLGAGWSKLAKGVPGRSGKRCRDRWMHHLAPGIRKDPWTEEEDVVLIQRWVEHGNKWVLIARYLPGRSDNSVKNRWYAHIKPAVNRCVTPISGPPVALVDD